MSNPAINPQHLTKLANLNLDLAQNQTLLVEFYQWAKNNIVQAVQKEVKREHGLDLRKKLDQLKFAQEIAKKELEKLGGQLMFIPNQLISQVKDLLGKGNGKEIGEDQVRLSVIKEILELEQQIEKFDTISREEYILEKLIDEEKDEEEIKLYDLLFDGDEDDEDDEEKDYIALWDQQSVLVRPILQILEKYDRTYRFRKRLCSENDFIKSVIGEFVRPQSLLESLFNFGLIYNDLETEVASSDGVEIFKDTIGMLNQDIGHRLLVAFQQERWDILAALLREQKETPDVKTFWKTYFLRKKRERKIRIEDELKKNLEFIRDCPQLTGLCDLVDLVKNLEGRNYILVVNFLNQLLEERDVKVIHDKTFNFEYDWLKSVEQKLGRSSVETIFYEYFGLSFSQIEKAFQEKFSRHKRNQDFSDYYFNTKDLLKQHYQTLGLTINATIDEVKKQYRKLAQKFHPDLGGDAEKMKSINLAYESILATSG
jgi:hypothetical protein